MTLIGTDYAAIGPGTGQSLFTYSSTTGARNGTLPLTGFSVGANSSTAAGLAFDSANNHYFVSATSTATGSASILAYSATLGDAPIAITSTAAQSSSPFTGLFLIPSSSNGPEPGTFALAAPFLVGIVVRKSRLCGAARNQGQLGKTP